MRKFLFTFVFAILLFTCTSPVIGQKKELSYDQIFKGSPSGVLRDLSTIKGWADDDHYLIPDTSTQDKSKLISVDVQSGIAAPYSAKAGSALADLHLNHSEKNPTLSPDGHWVAYTRNNNLFAKELQSGKEIQFTKDGSDNIYSGYSAWLYYEEILGRPSHYQAFWWSPDSRHIAFMRFDESAVPIFPIYNSEGQHGSLEQQHYPKAGDPNPAVRIGMVSVDHPETIWADFNEKDDQYFAGPTWTPDGSSLWVQWMPRSQNNLKVYAIDPTNGSKKEIYDEKQKTWIDLDLDGRIEFLPSGKGCIIKSDRSGWTGLYLYGMDGKLINPLVEGRFVVSELVKMDEKNKAVFFTARKENSARIDLYRVGLDGRGMKRISSGDFNNEVSSSPNGKYFILTYSNLQSPPKISLIYPDGKPIRELGNSKGPEFDHYELAKTEMVRVKSADGQFDLPMTITYPLHFDPSKKYPVLISIYGGPGAGTVFDRWNNRGFLSSQWWAKEGLIQVTMDNRSSGHFGKEGMNYIFRQLGKYEIEDYMDCARWLRAKPFVDTSKICIAGSSFGGYITCMALTYGADLFNYGLAGSSVTDWRLYDSHYTERYMNRPQDNEEGYRLTSPMTYLKKYRGLIRIIHGNMDDNVHMQNSIQMINKLEDMDKHFEFMIYPGERHGWVGLKAVHSRNENTLFIYEHLLNKPMPESFWK
ncbi:MAG: DPP IV N-terminal domain-containing protein [Chitinophagales bacterium]